MEFGLHSEIGKLRKVLMHRPGEELKKVTPEKLDYYRFRGLPRILKMQEEFDDFTAILKENFIEVILLNDFLAKSDSPNLLYTRDYIGVSEKGLIVMNMALESRKHEPKIAKESLKKNIPIHIEIKNPGLLEGGDLVYIDEQTLAIGFGPRSNIDGVKILVNKMKNTSIKEFVLVPLPSFRVHLDGAFMCVDYGTFIVHDSSLGNSTAQIIGKKNYSELFLDYLRKKGYQTLSVSDEETKTFGSNLLTISPGKIISYEWNKDIIRRMEKKGCEVITIQGNELVKGGGGPHCMTSPILREK